MPLQEEHDVADVLLPRPAFDHARAQLGAEAADLGEPLRLQFEDGQRLLAEVVDDALGHARADALDDAGGEVAFESGGGDGRVGDEAGDAQVPSVLGMQLPLAGDLDQLTGGDAGQCADEGGQLVAEEAPAVVGAQPGDGEARLRIAEDDALNSSGKRGHGPWLHPIVGPIPWGRSP